jgi:hypothetical protein
MTCTAHPILFERKTMGGAGSTYGGEEKHIQCIGGET